jgi:hypothetical protein
VIEISLDHSRPAGRSVVDCTARVVSVHKRESAPLTRASGTAGSNPPLSAREMGLAIQEWRLRRPGLIETHWCDLARVLTSSPTPTSSALGSYP